MTASALIPQFTLETEADVASLLDWKRDRAESVTDVLLAATAKALRVHPAVNSYYDEPNVLHHDSVNVGLAVETSDGLIVPCIANTDQLSLDQVRRERARLVAAARHGSLTPPDIFGASFTISNLGSLGIRRFQALVVPGQAAILAVGSVTSKRTASLVLSCDHRVVDGAPAARFLTDVAQLIADLGWIEALREDDDGDA